MICLYDSVSTIVHVLFLFHIWWCHVPHKNIFRGNEGCIYWNQQFKYQNRYLWSLYECNLMLKLPQQQRCKYHIICWALLHNSCSIAKCSRKIILSWVDSWHHMFAMCYILNEHSTLLQQSADGAVFVNVRAFADATIILPLWTGRTLNIIYPMDFACEFRNRHIGSVSDKSLSTRY